MSKLCDGLIPPRTACPFKDVCQLVSICKHLGTQHITVYNCSSARMYDRKERDAEIFGMKKPVEPVVVRSSTAPKCTWDKSYEAGK